MVEGPRRYGGLRTNGVLLIEIFRPDWPKFEKFGLVLTKIAHLNPRPEGRCDLRASKGLPM